ncbi:CAP domain-containing protein [Paractinoplanes ferrugineus]|nr:CAP domain-containing protein [Actinoplanes ferrugineus]
MTAAARFRYTLVAGATAVVIGTGFTVIGLNRHAEAEPAAATAADQPRAESTTAAAKTDSDLLTDPTAAPSATPSATKPPSPGATPKKTVTTRPTVKPTRTRAKATAQGTAPKTGDEVLDAVLSHINSARVAEGLGALTLDADLSKASGLHNQLMISGCGLSHQCSGEKGLGDRFSAQSVKWNSAGENIGYGSSGSSNAELIKAANGLTDSMLAEVPPNDGHRKNLLNKGFARIGLSVVRDSKGITWMTQDFVN